MRWLYSSAAPAEEVAASVQQELANRLGAGEDQLSFYDEEDLLPLKEVVSCIQSGRLGALPGPQQGVLTLRVQINKPRGNLTTSNPHPACAACALVAPLIT
jgi:hypothetical protein